MSRVEYPYISSNNTPKTTKHLFTFINKNSKLEALEALSSKRANTSRNLLSFCDNPSALYLYNHSYILHNTSMTVLKKRTAHTSVLNEQLARTILDMVKEDKSLNEIAKELKINTSTIYSWKYENVAGFADALEKAQLEGELKRAQDFSRRLMEMGEDEESGKNVRLLAIKHDESKFLRSNLINAKRMYDNRQVNNTVVVLPTPILQGLEGEVVKNVDNKGDVMS